MRYSPADADTTDESAENCERQDNSKGKNETESISNMNLFVYFLYANLW